MPRLRTAAHGVTAFRRAWTAATCIALMAAPLAVGAQAVDDEQAGRKLFTEVAQPPCGLCHALAAAGATGRIGPSLDELKPDADRVVRALKQHIGVMPPFDESLTDEQIAVLARYVARASRAMK